METRRSSYRDRTFVSVAEQDSRRAIETIQRREDRFDRPVRRNAHDRVERIGPAIEVPRTSNAKSSQKTPVACVRPAGGAVGLDATATTPPCDGLET
jgi:hypothetical protein